MKLQGKIWSAFQIKVPILNFQRGIFQILGIIGKKRQFQNIFQLSQIPLKIRTHRYLSLVFQINVPISKFQKRIYQILGIIGEKRKFPNKFQLSQIPMKIGTQR